MVRKVISVFLSLMILSQSVIRYVPVEAANESSDESAALLTQHDQQEVDNLTQDRYIQTDVTYYGVSVNSANGKKIIVESGSLFISQNSVVNVDIELRGKAVLIIEGTVNATVTISTTSSPSASAIPSAQNGQNNFELHSQGVVQEIVLNQRFGMGRIEGSVDHLTFHANAGGTVVLSSSANIDTIDYHSTANTIQNMTGNIARLNIFSGSVNLDQATVTTVVRRDYANLTIQPSGSVVTLISKNTGEGQGRTTTAGHVNTLYAEKAPTTNTGYIKNAFISNAEYDAHRDSRYGLVQPYLTENIFAHGAMLIMRGAATVDSTIADPTDRSNVGTLHLYNSSMDLGNINIEQTHITGELNDSHFLNVAIGKLYFEATQDNAVEKLNLTQTSNVSAAFIEMSKEVYDLNFDAAVALMVVDKSSTINIQEANKKKAEDWFKANITESAGIARNNETDTFSVALTEGDTVQITLASVFGLAVAVVTDQNGEVVFAAGGNNAASTNQFIADSTGTYTITRLSNGYGATLSTQKIERSRIHINAKVATNHTHDTPEQAEAINFKEFTYTVTNPNTNDSVPFILSKDGTLSLSNEYNGVSLDLKAKHQADNGKNVWAWQQTSTSFTPGSDTSITFTARQNGQAYGKTAQRVDDLRVYIYNADGNYVGAAQTSSDDNNTSFTTNPLPTGKYALVLIRDIGGNFNYQNISDFRKNNLRDSVDYVQYNFTSEHGIMESFLDIKVPRGPFMELSGFDEKTRYYAKETAAPVGTNIEFCLSYGFSDDAKDHMTDMSAVLLFTDNCTLLGDWEGQGNTITIPLDMNQDELSVIVRLNEGGEYVLSSAVIHYKYDGEARSVSLGTASCESIAISIVSPSATAHSNVPIRGFAVPNSIVTIYDNNVPYAQIESGADGLYSYELTIDTQADPNHKLRAAIYAGTSEEISSETVTLTYDVLTPQVQQFTFEYLTGDQRDKQTLTGKEFVTKRWIYEYRPGDVMKITCDLVNSQHVERLWLVSTSDQTHQSLELYREDSGTWVGTGTFSDDIHYRPGDFQLTYQMKSDFAQTDEGEYEIPKMPSIPDLPEMPIGDEQMRALLGGVDISINLEVLTQEIANDRATAIMRAKLPDYPELYYDLFVDSEKVDIVDSVETYQREGYTVEIVANATILTRSGVDKDGNPTFETIYLLPNDEGNARARKSGLTTKVTVVNQGLSGASLLSVAGNGIILNQANNNQDAVAAYRGEYSEWIASISELFKPSYEFLNSLIDKHDLEYETTKKINAIASEVEGVEKSDPLLNAMQTKIGLLTDILYSYTNIEKELDQYQAFVEDDSLPKIETLAYNNMAKVVSAGVVGYGIPAIALQSGIAEVFLGDLGDGLAGEYTVSLAKQADAADDVNNGTSPEDVLGDASALIAERAINSGQRVYSSWRDSFEESSQTTVNEKITLELEKVQEVIQAKEDTLMDSQRDTDEKLATFMAAHTEIFLDAFQGSIPTWSYCIMDSSGYVYEAVTSNRISNVLVKTYQPDGKGNWNLWETTGYTQENPIHTDVTGRYLLFLPNDSFQVAFEKEGYLAETIQVSDQTRTRLIDNIALHSQSAPKVVSATLTDEYVLVQFDRYVDVDTASDFMSVNGIKLAAEPVSPEPSGFEADKMYARSFIGMLDSKEQISAQIGSDYKLEVSDTALSYANVQIQPYEQTLKCQPVIKSIDITPPTYLVVGEETILNVKLTSDHDLTGFEFNIEPDSDLIEIVSVGEVQADGTTQVVVRALSVEAANLTFSASATTLTLPILAAREDLDQKVIEYAMLSSGVNQINSIIIYGVAAAAVILLGFGIMSVIRARRRRLQPTA